jgi:hypothetical protein
LIEEQKIDGSLQSYRKESDSNSYYDSEAEQSLEDREHESDENNKYGAEEF